jgi:toxin YoeB
MEVIFTPKALSDLDDWEKSRNIIIRKRIQQLLQSIRATPFEGIGKPEPLKHGLSGKWSRRINQEHRLIYNLDDNKINIYSLKGHY